MTADEWKAFEADQWRDAVMSRGLKITSLDVSQRELVCQAMVRRTLRKALEIQESLRAAAALLRRIR
jgi:environmental stress-induced protein Ves